MLQPWPLTLKSYRLSFIIVTKRTKFYNPAAYYTTYKVFYKVMLWPLTLKINRALPLMIVRLIGANFWQNCSIDEESMKLSTQVLWCISFNISYGSTLKNSIWPPFSRWRKRDEFWTLKLFLWHILKFFLHCWWIISSECVKTTITW